MEFHRSIKIGFLSVNFTSFHFVHLDNTDVLKQKINSYNLNIKLKLNGMEGFHYSEIIELLILSGFKTKKIRIERERSRAAYRIKLAMRVHILSVPRKRNFFVLFCHSNVWA